MTDEFLIGILIGMVMMGALWVLNKSTYQDILLHIALHRGRERLKDGRFYYIVHESEFHEMEHACRTLRRHEALETDVLGFASAVENACVVNFLPFHPKEPEKTLAELVRFEVEAALDPAISSRARALMGSGKKIAEIEARVGS
jgi:hypothetical protein